MDMVTVGWIAVGWFTLAVLVSLVLGSIFRQVNATPPNEADVAVVAERQKVVHLRYRNPTLKTHISPARQRQEPVRQAVG
jgi:hypothetical protein